MKWQNRWTRQVLSASIAWTLAVPAMAFEIPFFTSKDEKEKQAVRDQITKETLDKVLNSLQGPQNLGPALRVDLGEHLLDGKDGYYDGEAKAIQQATVDVVKTILTRSFNGDTPGVVRGDHGKGLACLNGKMTVFAKDQIPEHLQKGVIVPGAEYPVQGRFSNAEFPGRADRTSLSQGVALKLKNVSKAVGSKTRLPDFPNSDEQDFLMTSDPVFFLSNIVQYSVAFGLRAGDKSLAEKISTIVMTKELHPRLVEETKAQLRSYFSFTKDKPKNILTHPYWSKHPYAWGEKGESSKAVKYSVEPCENSSNLTPTSDELNYQVGFITEGFSQNGEVCFYLRVQTRPDGATERDYPIEDGNILWPDNAQSAPFVRVAKIVFPANLNNGMLWRSAEGQAQCAQTEFNPWNGLMAHQPLSNLARGRRFVYKASALVREMKPELDPRIQKAK